MKSSNTLSSSRQRGFALIEALIAVVVLATGLLALTALQGALIRSSADAKARSMIAAYAQSEMDRLRLAGAGTGLVDSSKSSTTAPAGDPLKLVAASAGLGSVNQSVAVDYFIDRDGDGDFELASSDVEDPNGQPYFKRVEMVLTWKDVANTDRNLRFSTMVSPLTLSLSKKLIDDEDDDSSLRPIVRRKTPVSEGMIPIALASGEDTAATNPKPELVGSKNDTYVADTRFEVLTYDSGDNLGVDTYVRFNKRIETAFVGCTCQTGADGFPIGGSNPPINVLLRDRAYRPSYWDGTVYTEPESAGAVVRSPSPGATQSELCDVCCRDHRDSASDTPKYNPWIGNHGHYNSSGVVVPEASSGSFQEACRVIRVGGVWRVTPDPRLEDMALLATRVYPSDRGSTVAPQNNNRALSPLTAPVVSSSLDEPGSYIHYIYNYLSQKFYDKTSVDRLALQASRGLNVPDYVPLGEADSGDMDGDGNTTETDVRWLHSRGLLTDALHEDAVERIDQAIAECDDTSTALKRAQCILPYLPISTINVTELAVWVGKQVSETGIDASSFPDGALVNYGQAWLNRFASAIARIGPIGPEDDDAPLKDEQTFMLIPGVVKSGIWLKLASPAGTAFGDATKPVRGFATVAGPVKFSVTLNGISGTTEAGLTTRPGVEVGTSGTNKCTPNSALNSNPYACTSDAPTAVTLALGDYNRQASSNSNVKVCNDTKFRKQAMCLTYGLTGAVVDGISYTPAAVSYTVVSDGGTPNERSTLLLPTLRSPPDPDSTAVLQFSENSVPATAQCNVTTGAFVQWTCP